MEPLLHIGDQLAADTLKANEDLQMNPHTILERILEAPFGKENDLIKQVKHVPTWVDFDAIRRAQKLFWIYHVPISICLFHGSLAGGFAADRMNQILIKTGHLSSPSIVRKRVLETAQMIMDIMQPGGLEVGSQGWKSVLLTRLIHAHVRERLRTKVNDSVPVNQADMLATIAGFQAVVVLNLTKLGIYWTHQQREDYTHLWRYVAYLIGVEDRFNVLSNGFIPSVAYIKEYVHRYFQPTEDSSKLTNTLLRSFIPSETAFKVNSALSRYIIGEPLANALRIDTASLYYRLVLNLLIMFVLISVFIHKVFGDSYLDFHRKRMKSAPKMIGQSLVNFRKKK